MNEIAVRRLKSQSLVGSTFRTAAEVVAYFGAMQAQEYLCALWAVGMRVPDSTEAEIRQAVEQREIVRGWPMRGTIHFTAAEDTRWILELTAPRQLAIYGRRLAELGLDEATLAQANDTMAQALDMDGRLSRPQLFKALEAAGVSTAGQRGAYMLYRAVLDRVICQVGVERNTAYYMPFEAALPDARSLPRDEALAELTRRYFQSHGPATAHDFAWWAGLTVADAKEGIGGAGKALEQETMDGGEYWSAAGAADTVSDAGPVIRLLPMYDEYLVAYRDRSASVSPAQMGSYGSGNNPVFSWVILINGQARGIWKRTVKKDTVEIELMPDVSLSAEERDALDMEVQRFANFVEKRLRQA
jgi:hypothetical protein